MPLLAVGALFAIPAAASGQIVSNSAAVPGNASGAAVDMPGLLIVNKSASSQSDAKVTALNVGGWEVLGYQDGRYRGAAASSGATIDSINARTCPPRGEGGGPCTRILYMNTDEFETPTGASRSAEAELLGYQNRNGAGFSVAGSRADSGRNSVVCSDGARGYLLTTDKGYTPTPTNNLLSTQAVRLANNCGIT